MEQFETARLILREIKLEDADIVEEFASDYQLAKTTLNIPHPYPKGSAKEFLANCIKVKKEGKLKVLAVTLKPTNEFIGMVNISIHKKFLRGELAYWIGKPFWGNGYGTEAAKEMVRIGFDELMLNRVFAQSFTMNPGSYRIMEKIGLQHEGILKDHVSRDGEFYDLTVYGIIEKHYR